MKKLFFALAALAALAWPQPTATDLGFKDIRTEWVTWTAYNKTRVLILSPDSVTHRVYVDTSTTGQTGAWRRTDNATDSCSNPFFLASDSLGGTRGASARLWEIVRAVDGDSSAHMFRIQTRERFWNNTAKAFQWTAWTRYGVNRGIRDSVLMSNIGTTSKASQYTEFRTFGVQGRLCPDNTGNTALAATDSLFLDSLRVSSGGVPVPEITVSSAGGGGAEGTVDLTGINGVTPSTGNGTAGTGTLRVAIASNNTAFTVNAAQATASSLNAEVQGDAAHDAAVSGNPLLMGGYASATAPTAVSADGDAVRLWLDLNGRLQIGDGGGSLTVDASSLPLPTGAATAANQSTANTALSAIQTAVETLDNTVSGSELQVDVLTLPALAAGTNNIGDVDVLSLNDGGNSVTVDNGGTFAVQAGQAAHDAAIAGNPVRTGLRAATAHPTAVATGDQVDQLGTVEGKAVVQPYAVHGESWRYAAASGGITDATAVTVKAAAGSGVRNCITSIQVINGHASVSTEVLVLDGAAGTVIWRGFAQAAGGGAAAEFPVPLCGTANTLLEVDNGTTGAAVYYNLQGFESQE